MRFLWVSFVCLLLLACVPHGVRVLPDKVVEPAQSLPPAPIPPAPDKSLLPFEHFMKLEKEWDVPRWCTGWLPVPDNDKAWNQVAAHNKGYNGLVT